MTSCYCRDSEIELNGSVSFESLQDEGTVHVQICYLYREVRRTFFRGVCFRQSRTHEEQGTEEDTKTSILEVRL